MTTNEKYHQFQTPERKADQDSCVKESLTAGVKGGLWGFGTATTIVALANHFSSGFRTSLGISGKTALAVSPGFLLFWLQSELTMGECARRKRHEGAGKGGYAPSTDIIPERRG